MAVKSSGPISIQDIVNEFGGTEPHSLDEYYRGGSRVPNVSPENANVPSSGAISLEDFYGAQNIFFFNVTSNTQELDLIAAAKTAGWNEASILRCIVDEDAWVWSDDTTKPGLLVKDHPSSVQIHNYGKIIGKGGDGGNNGRAGKAGGPAIETQNVNVSITNFDGAFIAGGGGGGAGGGQTSGGGGAGGGKGGNGQAGTGGAGGAIGEKGKNGTGSGFGIGYGGEAGGAGGGVEEKKGTDRRCSAGGGGRILPGAGQNAAEPGWPGGFGGEAGQSGGRPGRTRWGKPTTDYRGGYTNHAGAGGGGWGAAGGNAYSGFGGAGGRAIKYATGKKPTLTNDGTVYGATE